MSGATAVDELFDSTVDRPLLGLVYGRRRIGKSTMLVRQARARDGFYYEAARVETTVQLERLGRALGEHLGVGRVALADWDEAIAALLALGQRRATPVVLDEVGHLLEADRSFDSIVASALGPGGRPQPTSRARVVLCGSAISLMRSLTAGQAPLRGRASMELVMQPDDFRAAASRLPRPDDHALAVQVFAVIGGVVGYATDMVGFDLPDGLGDLDRWIIHRVLSPAATLHHEATTLLAEDPVLAASSSLLHHSILAAIANGSVTAGSIARRVGKPVSNLAPALHRLVDAGFVDRQEDPLRDRRPLYSLADPFLQFHYAVLEPHRAQLRDRDLDQLWTRTLRATFDAQVRGPVFEAQARAWMRRFADPTRSATGAHVGPSQVTVEGVEHQLDLAVADSDPVPAARRVLAIGEAKAGEVVGRRHLTRLERSRAALGPRAADASLLLFGSSMAPDLTDLAAGRPDVELVDLRRLYEGS